MNHLRELEARFRDEILLGPVGDRHVEFAKDLLADRMHVYANGYLSRICDALKDEFEAVGSVLGDEEFFQLVRRYIAEHPSTHFDLAEMGRKFSDYIAKDPSSRTHPFLGDVARLEWAIHESFHGREIPKRTREEFESQSTSEMGDMTFELQPWVRLVNTEWKILDLWASRKDKEGFKQNVERASSHYLVYRVEFDVMVKELDADSYRVLLSLHERMSLEAACSKYPLDRADQLQALFSEWMTLGLFGQSSNELIG